MLVNSEGVAEADAACGAMARLACAQSVLGNGPNVTGRNYALHRMNTFRRAATAKKS
jgi:hypothetical protein